MNLTTPRFAPSRAPGVRIVTFADPAPYKFIVDSGADTSAVGLRIAHDLKLPLGSQAILNGMTSRDLVDRVKIDSLTLGPTIARNLEVPALRETDLGGDGLLGIDA